MPEEAAIVCDPAVLGGEPTVQGTRISVRSVVLAAQEYGGVEGARRAYPQLERQVIQQALRYYQAHRAEIERYIEANATED